MTETTMDKARLAAFVDGELSPEDAAEVVMHLANDPVDQAYVDELMALNVIIADAYDAEIIRMAPEGKLAPARRKAMVHKFATHAARRLQQLKDPGFSL